MVGDCGEQFGRDLAGKYLAQGRSGNVARGRGPQECYERLVLFPHREEPGQQDGGDTPLLARDLVHFILRHLSLDLDSGFHDNVMIKIIAF